MNNRKKFTSFFIALVFTLSLLFNNFTGLISTTSVAVAATNTSVNQIEDGAILHAWNWSFDTIKAKLPEIKEAGYTAIQTSPIQGNKEDLMSSTKWWILYQPINFKIGNAQLGSREQFKSMCEEADKYGIDIIVDVVANHTGNRGGGSDAYYPATNVDSTIKDNENFWHEHRGVEDWNDRWQVTHWGIGLPDLNTSNWELQDMVIEFLNDAIACGADGFRFDAAKHIELPTDSGGSDFWPRVLGSLDRDDLFIYGEVLQGGADNINGYHTYMRTTCDWYGGSVRSAVGYYGNADVNNAKSYTVSGDPSNLVTWVESHDTYANENMETVGLTNEQIKLGWAIIAGRADSTPLFFNRTSGGYLAGNMGSAGDDMWKDPIVVAANNFRNAMAGEGEYIRAQGNNLFITERGTKGVMIVNVGDSTYVNCDTNLPNGQYTDSVSGNTFTVSNGKLTGNIGSRTIATLGVDVKTPVVSSSVATGSQFVDSLNVTLTAKNTTTATYSENGGTAKTYTNGTTITLGKDANIGDTVTLTLTGKGEDGTTVTETYEYKKVDKIENSIAKIKLPSGWSSANIYVYDGSGSTVKEIAKWPGVAMTNEGNGVYSYTLPDGWGDDTQVIFNNGTAQIPAAEQDGFSLPTNKIGTYVDGNWTLEDIKTEAEVEVSSSVADGTEFTDVLNVTLNAKNTTEATYSIDGKEAVTYTDGTTIKLGEDIEAGSTVELTLTGKGSNGNSVTKTYTYKKADVIVSDTSIAKIKLPSGWTSANIYVYDESGSTVKEIAKWPGVAMTNEGNGVYSYTLPEGWGDNTQVIFNNGSAQIPAAQQAGFSLPTNKIGTYADGNWTLEDISKPITISSFTSDKSSPQYEGTTITLSADATGGSGSLQYKFTATENTTGEEKVISDYSSKNSVEWTPLTAGTYEVKVSVKDSNGNVEEKSFDFEVKEVFKELQIKSITLDKSQGNLGEAVTISAEAEGGSGTLNYKVYYKKDGVYTLIQAYSTSNTVKWTPDESGDYIVYVDVRDGSGTTKTAYNSYEVIGDSVTIKSFEADKTSVEANTEVTLTANAEGGTGELNYKFYYKYNDKYTKIQDYSTKNSANWTPTEDGYYKLYVDVKDEAGNVKTKAFDFIVGNVDDLEMEFTLSTKSGVVNTPVTIDATSEGGVNPITYKFYYKKDGTYTMIKDYSDSSSIEWTPEEEGTYAVYVAAKDASGKIVSKYTNFIVGKGVEITDISLDKTTIKVGDSVNIKTTATGNSNLQYRVAVHDFENTWTTLHDFKSSNTTTWTPEIADKYVIWVDVIDEDGNYDSKSIEVTVTE
ncbi:MAG: starch-binding protein [Turicibacter sp.]|nr:starch-binding protein [Turicibacter sp.]